MAKLVPDEVTKKPWEERDFAIEWASVLYGETIASVVSVTSANKETGADSTATLIKASAISGTKTLIRLMNHLDGEVHVVSTRLLTSGGQKIEGEFTVVITQREH